ncbi:MAG: endolytic transglycosylase MltG [Bacteroidota bacterium]|nr:endolytic transglycosylase MltG [Bacteroidota bacterium]MDP4251789.1 endolytic transglycosylase MltG [Bacteroidota bacterium]
MQVKKVFSVLIFLILLMAIMAVYFVFGPGTAFKEAKYDLYIRTGTNYETLVTTLRQDQVISHPALFNWMAGRTGYPEKIKAGKYEIKQGMSLIHILKMLQNGRQVPVNLVITKLRTKEDLAGLVGRKFECDSAAFMAYLNNPDSLGAYALDSNTVMTAIFPNTYTYFWNSTASRIFRKMEIASRTFWTSARIQKAETHHLDAKTTYILASIVEEETTRKEDKPKIASVYLNRLSTGMKLAADPTVKFALRNFELKRVYSKYLAVESPYNTYRNAGLPPGPICTPSVETIEAVLNAPDTRFLYFVAKPDFSGYSNFAETYPEHMQNAREYQKALDEQMRIGQQAKGNP